MIWTQIYPRKSRPKCHFCQQRAGWRCDLCTEPKDLESLSGYFSEMAVCGTHKLAADASKAGCLVHDLLSADLESRKYICSYLIECGYDITLVMPKILRTKVTQQAAAIMAIYSICGDSFAKLLMSEGNKVVTILIRGLLVAIEPTPFEYAVEAIAVLGLFAKYGMLTSIEALRRCSKSTNESIRIAANHLLADWGKLQAMETAMYYDSPGWRNLRSHR